MTDFYDDDYDDLDTDSEEELEGGEDGDDSGNGESWYDTEISRDRRTTRQI